MSCPAHSLEAEQVVVSMCVLNADALADISGIVRPEDLYSPENREILRACYQLQTAGEAVDMVSLVSQLKRTGRIENIGGSAEVVKRIGASPAVANYLQHARDIVLLARIRSVGAVSGRLAAEAHGEIENAPQWLSEAETRIYEAARRDDTDGTTATAAEVVQSEQKTATELSESRNRPGADDEPDDNGRGVVTGWADLDRRIGRLKFGKKYALGGFPGAGKTSYAIQLGVTIAEHGFGVAFASMEMDRVEIIQRAVSIHAMVNNRRCEDYQFGPNPDAPDPADRHDVWTEVTRAWAHLSKLPIVIDDRPTFSIGTLRSWARRVKNDFDRAGVQFGALVLDHLHKMQSPTGVMNELGVSELSGATTELAKEFGIVLLELHPFNRQSHDQKKPTMRSFKGSSAVEHDSYGMFAIDRADLQNMDRSKHDGKAEILVLKMRGGGQTGSVWLHFTDKCTRFDNLSRDGYDDGYSDFDDGRF